MISPLLNSSNSSGSGYPLCVDAASTVDEGDHEESGCHPRFRTSSTTTRTTTRTTSTTVDLPKETNEREEEWIDNTKLIYIRFQLRESNVCVHVRPQVLESLDGQRMLWELDQDLVQCFALLPSAAVQVIRRRRIRIWINHTYIYGPQKSPIVLNHSTAHHHPAWLIGAGDRPDKASGIEIYNCHDFRRMRLHWNGCGLILHELIHLLHQWILGLDHAEIKDWFRSAKLSKKYQITLRRDWAGKAVETDLHYCMVDPKEFFAELSVTYLAEGYPQWDSCLYSPPCIPSSPLQSNNSEDKENHNNSGPKTTRHDPSSCRTVSSVLECSPPLMEPNVVARVIMAQKPFSYPSFRNHRSSSSSWDSHSLLPSMPHCNKFYPFTREQFRRHDPQLYQLFQHIWTVTIPNWQDVDLLEENGRDTLEEENEEEDSDEENGYEDWCCFRWLFHFPFRKRLLGGGSRRHQRFSNDRNLFS